MTAEMPEHPRENTDGSRKIPEDARQAPPAKEDQADPRTDTLMEEVVHRENLLSALKRVRSNKGAPGVDGVTVDELPGLLREIWPRTREELLRATYTPSPVKRVEIPKPDGGVRKLGIPTVMDRLIAQAILQVLAPIFEEEFSESSHGFRRSRGPHSAIREAVAHIRDGFRWVVDLDIEKFFDNVNHDVLMSRVARKIKDKRVLKVIRRYLQAGIMDGGLASPMGKGTPQGSPLSPLLSNIYLDDLDKELTRRGHRFVRYADDCNVYVSSRKAGERVMASITDFLKTRLRLRVNEKKSAVDRPWKRKFLGYSVTSQKDTRLKPAPEAVKRAKKRIREETGRKARGRNIVRVITDLNKFLRGWVDYYRLAQVKTVFDELDQWIRRRLRRLLWRQWKKRKTRYRRLVQLGLGPERAKRSAANGRGPWWNAGAQHMNYAVSKALFDEWKLLSLLQRHRLNAPKFACA